MNKVNITNNDIKLVRDIITDSKRTNTPVQSYLFRYNINPDALNVLLNMNMPKETGEDTTIDVYKDSLITDEAFDISLKTLENIEHILDAINEGNSLPKDASFKIMVDLLKLDIHKDIYSVRYIDNSMYKRVASEICTEFKDSRVVNYVENNLSRIFTSIFRSAIGIMDNETSQFIERRLIKHVGYKYLGRCDSGDSEDSEIQEVIIPALKVALLECSDTITETFGLYRLRTFKDNKSKVLKSTDTKEMDSVEEEDIERRIHMLNRYKGDINRKIDVLVKHCTYVIYDKCKA